MLFLLVALSTAAERSEDVTALCDTRVSDGVKVRVITVLGQHESYPASEWSSVRAAAVIGVTGANGLDDWYDGLQDSARKNWWAGLSSTTKTKYRNAILDLAA